MYEQLLGQGGGIFLATPSNKPLPKLAPVEPLVGMLLLGTSSGVFVLGPERCLLLPHCSFPCSNPALELAAIIPFSAKEEGARAAVLRQKIYKS